MKTKAGAPLASRLRKKSSSAWAASLDGESTQTGLCFVSNTSRAPGSFASSRNTPRRVLARPEEQCDLEEERLSILGARRHRAWRLPRADRRGRDPLERAHEDDGRIHATASCGDGPTPPGIEAKSGLPSFLLVLHALLFKAGLDAIRSWRAQGSFSSAWSAGCSSFGKFPAMLIVRRLRGFVGVRQPRIGHDEPLAR
ncbi:MAG: hypothetical protein IPK74_34640 [Deltaproteobacteria bacterium]|nr:hypothetical protein [Deltaproteobacteria bacterium]